MQQKPYIFVTVGTDHHPFDRLMRWVDAWLAETEQDVDIFVQCGTSEPPARAPWQRFLTYEEMTEHLDRATVVVCHGGPGCIMDAKSRGLVPLVIPRRGGEGEAVDSHQVAFSQRLSDAGDVWLAETVESFVSAMCRLIEEGVPGRARLAGDRRFDDAVRRLEALVSLAVSTKK